MTCPDIFLNDLFLFQGRVSKIFVFIVPLWDGICFLGEGFCHYPREKKIFPHKYCRDWPYVVETLPWLPSAFDGWWFFPRWILPTAFGGWKLFPSVYFLRNFSLMKYRLNGRIFTPASNAHKSIRVFLFCFRLCPSFEGDDLEAWILGWAIFMVMRALFPFRFACKHSILRE